MAEKTPFIQRFLIRNVRHLKNIDIEIDDDHRRTLILTGPNGSGKTSVLEALGKFFQFITSRRPASIENLRTRKDLIEKQLEELKNQLGSNQNRVRESDSEYENQIKHKNDLISQLQNIEKDLAPHESFVVPQLSDVSTTIESYHAGNFLIAFFGAKRESKIESVAGPKKLELPKVSPVEQQLLAPMFLQFLVNQETRADHFHRKGNTEDAENVEKWKNSIRDRFRSLFQNEKLELVYDIDNFDFTIEMPGREPFRLVENQLADGYSSVIEVIAELVLRMESVAPGRYDMPGIVLIDEIETHLHIELQKEILPFLTDFFPNIQFVVTTHSPFVLNSLADSVVFDLETSKRWECMAPLSASTIIEEYFDSNLYSSKSRIMLEKYRELSQNKSREPDEEAELIHLRKQLDAVDFDQSPELVAYYKGLRAKERPQ